MKPSELQVLEKIQIGDLKSAMDQIKYLIIQNNLAQTNIVSLYAELDKKINLKSEYLTETDPVIMIGTGTVSVSGNTITGTGTLFTKETIIGNSIKIGTETQTIQTINSDTSIIVVSPYITTSTNQVYGILKLISKELLTGNFQFGEVNGDTFNGVINQGSVLQHFGRMTDPNDVINLQFAQKLSAPALIRASQSILRIGDTVDGGTSIYEYLFKNLNWTFDPTTSLYYEGPITDPNHVVTLEKLNEIQSGLQESMYATWNTLQTDGINFAVGSTTIKSRLGPSLLPDDELNFNSYFTNSTTGLIFNPSTGLIPSNKTGILLFVSASAYTNFNLGADIYSANCGIYKNGSLVVQGISTFDGPAGFTGWPGATVSAIIPLKLNDTLVIGTDCANTIPTTMSIRHYCSIAKIGLY